jgi:hypothetical protein
MSQSQPPQMLGEQPPGLNINQLQDQMCNLVYNFCSIVTMPVEMALRPRYGSRYFSPLVLFFSAVMMIVVPVFFAVTGAIGGMIPFMRSAPPRGIIGMGDLSRYFFIGAFIHGIRIWRRMIHMEREQCSTHEGPPLPLFYLFPKGNSFWVCRIVWEPVFLILASIVLTNLLILQSSAATYLQVAAVALAMKQYVAWYQQWQYLRQIMDMRFTGPIIARLAENQATDKELAAAHLASFPKDLPSDVRRGAAQHLARIYSAQADAPQTASEQQQSA